MLVLAVIVTGVLGAVSFALSYAGLVEVAAWARVPAWLAWAVPVVVDGAILVYTIAALVFRARGEAAGVEWSALAGFAALSVVANGVHAWDGAPAWVRTVLGVGIAGLAPVAVLLATHTLARLVIAPVDGEGVAPIAAVASARAATEVAALQPSPDRNHEIARLRREEKLSGKQIAARIGVSPSTVSRVLSSTEATA
ncbi:DUF2637 domain-containing protein [Microbacterium sp. BG28]|uniref:DUF2637 domain-containing protein n=1 Tax=Microbacterium sp. BG28 TaxID=3097356 RepID=UPI002A5ACC69|nr:DUF2637 domain-containing protein [Microbacterium sp. BG28]MDY0829114.1 DUF2637 domain-containing protein [Microbacterium sp. BG28]